MKKSMYSLKKFYSLIIMLICIMIFTGCQKEGSGQTDYKADGTVMESSHYVEREIKLPEKFLQNGEKVLAFIQNREQEFELYGTYMDSDELPVYTKYTLTADGTWNEGMPEWLNDSSLGIYCQQLRIFMGEDWNRYAVFETQDGQYHIIKTINEATSEEINIDAWKVKNGDYYPVVSSVAILEDGLIAATLMDGTCQIYKEGKMLKEFSGGESFFITGASDKIVRMAENNTGIVIYHTSDNTVDQEISMEASAEEYTPLLQLETTYIANSYGISRLDESDGTWIRIMDGTGTSLNNPAFSPRWLYKNSAESYFVFFISSHGSKLVEYLQSTEAGQTENLEKDAAEEKVGGSDTLTIYALEDSKIIRSAISNFRTSHPEIKVEFQVKEDGESTATRSEIIRALNAKLFAGDGPDILLLDGLPIDSYVEKGVLYDMGKIVADNSESVFTELYSGIREAYSQSGSCYMIPARIGIPVYAGTKEVIAHAGSLEELAAFASQSNLPYFGEISYRKLIEDFYPYYADLFIKDGGQIDKDALIEFLTQIKMIAENVPAAENVDKEIVDPWNYMGFGESSLSVSVLKGMSYQWAAEHFSAVRNINGELITINDRFVPYSIMGINNASGNKGVALEFVKEVLSEEIQSIEFLDEGFPVNQKSARQWQDTDKEFIAAAMNEAGDFIPTSYPDKKEREQLFGYISNLKIPVYQDEIILEMIVSETNDYFKGVENVEKAVEKIINNAELYMAE